MTTTRLHDPLQLTVFDPSHTDLDHPKEESLLGKVFRRVTGSQARLSGRASQNPSRHGSFASCAVYSADCQGSQVDFHRSQPGRTEAASGSLYSPGPQEDTPTAQASDVSTNNREEQALTFPSRTLGGVLQRLKAISSKGNAKDLQPFQDSDFKHYWVPDSISRECFECGEKFTTFRRRRHCRVCGQIFCGRCADQEVPGHLLGFSGSLRMCSFCSQVVLSRAKYLDPALAGGGRRSSSSGGASRQLAHVSPSPSRTPLFEDTRYQLFSGQSQERPTNCDPLASRKCPDDLHASCEQLREIWLEMNHVTDGLELKIHRHRFRAFPDCVSGVEIVDWLIKRHKAHTRRQAVGVGQALLTARFLECLTALDTVFLDEYVLYKPKTVTNELEDASVLTASSDFVENEEPTWLREIDPQNDRPRRNPGPLLGDSLDDTPELDLYLNSFGNKTAKGGVRRTDSNVSLSSQVPDLGHGHVSSESACTSPVALFPPTLSSQISEEIAFRKPPELELLRNSEFVGYASVESETRAASLNLAFTKHLDALLCQLEEWEELQSDWHELILSLAEQVTENVEPSVRENHDDMDVRQYVHVKTIPGGKSAESAVISGVVCSKHVAHRKMRQTFINPKILLYASALEFEPMENGFNSLEPVMQEEAEFLKNCVSSLCEFQPDVVLVERNVSRLAQDYLFQEGITLVANVKPSVMDRVCRCTGADKFSLLDNHISQPRLGTCSKFEVKTLEQNAYMILDGCPKILGCTVLLRGDCKETLRKVKRILIFMVYCQYNWKLERSFLLDEHARLGDANWHCQLESDSERSVDFAGIIQRFISSVSPLIRPDLPFLLTDVGKRSAERFKLPDTLFWSRKMQPPNSPVQEKASSLIKAVGQSDGSCLLPPHSLLSLHLTCGINSVAVQRALASFRATGGRLEQPAFRPPADVSPLQSDLNCLPDVDVVDCFDTYRHQRLPILCSIHATEFADAMASFCVFPWILVIHFYGKNDLTLGDYLETFCFRLDGHCPNQQCSRSVKEHVRRFASGDAVISVSIRDLDSSASVPLVKTMTWTWCRICKKVSSVVPLSSTTWNLSFAKYLDLRLHASCYQLDSASNECTHSLHRDHIQYFALGQTVAAFKLGPLKLREMDSPPIVICLDDRHSLRERQELIEMTKTVAIKGHNVFASIADYLSSCQTLELEKLDEKLPALTALKRTEKQMFKDWLECLQLKLASPLLKFDPTTSTEADQLRDFIWDIEDSVNSLKRKLTETTATWSSHLSEIENIKRKEERKHAHNLKSFQSTPEFFAHEDMPTIPCMVSVFVEPASDDTATSPQPAHFLLGTEETESVGGGMDEYTHIELAGSPCSEHTQLPRSVTSAVLSHTTLPDTSHRDALDSASSRNSRMQKSGQSTGATNLVPFPFPPNEHYMLGETPGIPIVVYDDELSSMIAFALSSSDYSAQISQMTRPVIRREPRTHSRNVSGDSLNPPFRSDSPGSANKSSLEPVSPAISFLRDAAEGSAPFVHVEHSMSGPNTDRAEFDALEANSTKTGDSSKNVKSASKPAPEPKHYIEVQFGDQVAKFYCRIYFPEEFRLFRAMVFPYGEDRFIRSLSRSVAWKAAGGKSGSTFSKTADGRFVLKQMSRLEVQSFMEFAPHYFTFMAQAAKEKKPTVIAKVVGVYRIGFKNSLTGAQVKQDLLVMENLFYGRKIQQVYDLKGSLRNRLATTDTTKNDAELVLLDENFLKRICDNPLYIRPHAKIFLRKALLTDTQFLAGLYVMDYSLLVGIDEESREIVVGIIDYIRTFTWDKRLEMVVKSTNILGGQKLLPTIVSPELYRTRFCEAMERYFLPVPDQWYGLARFLDGI